MLGFAVVVSSKNEDLIVVDLSACAKAEQFHFLVVSIVLNFDNDPLVFFDRVPEVMIRNYI